MSAEQKAIDLVVTHLLPLLNSLISTIGDLLRGGRFSDVVAMTSQQDQSYVEVLTREVEEYPVQLGNLDQTVFGRYHVALSTPERQHTNFDVVDGQITAVNNDPQCCNVTVVFGYKDREDIVYCDCTMFDIAGQPTDLTLRLCIPNPFAAAAKPRYIEVEVM